MHHIQTPVKNILKNKLLMEFQINQKVNMQVNYILIYDYQRRKEIMKINRQSKTEINGKFQKLKNPEIRRGKECGMCMKFSIFKRKKQFGLH